MPRVHVAPTPAQTCMVRPAGDPANVRAEELVGQEEHLAGPSGMAETTSRPRWPTCSQTSDYGLSPPRSVFTYATTAAHGMLGLPTALYWFGRDAVGDASSPRPRTGISTVRAVG